MFWASYKPQLGSHAVTVFLYFYRGLFSTNDAIHYIFFSTYAELRTQTTIAVFLLDSLLHKRLSHTVFLWDIPFR
jgi:hypothetical protein